MIYLDSPLRRSISFSRGSYFKFSLTVSYHIPDNRGNEAQHMAHNVLLIFLQVSSPLAPNLTIDDGIYEGYLHGCDMAEGKC